MNVPLCPSVCLRISETTRANQTDYSMLVSQSISGIVRCNVSCTSGLWTTSRCAHGAGETVVCKLKAIHQMAAQI